MSVCNKYNRSSVVGGFIIPETLTMTTLVLWQLAGSPPSWAVRMMANILGLDVEMKDIDFMNLEHKSPEFKKMNPMGTVPVIKDGDFFLSESHTILKYLLSKYGKDEDMALYPSDVTQRALVDQAMFFDAGVAFIRVKNIAIPTIFEGLAGMSPKIINETEDVYGIVEDYLSDGRNFVASNNFTLADLTLGSTIMALYYLHELDIARFPLTASWLDRLRIKPFFQNIAVPGAARLGGFVKSTWEKNAQ